MAYPTTPEEKLDFEARVNRLNEEVGFVVPAVSGKTAPDFLDRFFGIFANDPNFDNITRFSEERREREREEANRIADEAERKA